MSGSEMRAELERLWAGNAQLKSKEGGLALVRGRGGLQGLRDRLAQLRDYTPV